MKIKQKKQLNLPQLIEWAQDNIEEAIKKVYRVNENEVMDGHVRFTEVYSDLEVRLHGYIPFDTTFTVEVEEEITEDTVIPKALNVFKNTTNRIKNDEESHIRRNVSIKEIKENSGDYIENDRLYIMNDDLTMTLIWRDGKLVE